jgi:hypothetical protein
VVADKFLRKIGAEAERSTERKDLEWTCGAVERGSTRGQKKSEVLGPVGMKVEVCTSS